MAHPPLEILRCPDCGPASPLAPSEGAAGCRCPACGREFPSNGGVLDLVPKDVPTLTQDTVRQFGDSWISHDHLASYQSPQFLDWIAPLSATSFEGKTVLEAGCGKGRHSVLMAAYGVLRLWAVDLSDAVLLAAQYSRDLPQVSCLRADLLRLPLADASQDLVVCVGVLHHLEDPQAGLREFWRVLKPGGSLCLWVYGREGNGWILHLVDPLRKGITSRIPTFWLRPLLLPLSLFLFALLKLLYGPLTGRGQRTVSWLPYSSYLGYISKFPFREVEHIVLDHLCTPVAFYLSRPQLEEMFRDLHPAELSFRWHNRNSWNVIATKAAAP